MLCNVYNPALVKDFSVLMLLEWLLHHFLYIPFFSKVFIICLNLALYGGINMAEVLVVASKIKDAIKTEGCNTASDAVDAISAKVAKMVKEAADRAKENGRKTVRACDF